MTERTLMNGEPISASQPVIILRIARLPSTMVAGGF